MGPPFPLRKNELFSEERRRTTKNEHFRFSTPESNGASRDYAWRTVPVWLIDGSLTGLGTDIQDVSTKLEADKNDLAAYKTQTQGNLDDISQDVRNIKQFIGNMFVFDCTLSRLAIFKDALEMTNSMVL